MEAFPPPPYQSLSAVVIAGYLGAFVVSAAVVVFVVIDAAAPAVFLFVAVQVAAASSWGHPDGEGRVADFGLSLNYLLPVAEVLGRFGRPL